MKNSILLADHEKESRESVAHLLSDEGHTIIQASNGMDAIDLLVKMEPPIVITEIKMPGMDGIELLKIIKRKKPDTEVIMLTRHGNMEMAIQSIHHNAFDFITKPVDVNRLRMVLKNARNRIISQRALDEYTRRLEETIREKIAIQDRLSSIGLMASSISHDLKGLVTGLDGGVYILKSGFEKKNDARIKEGMDIVGMMAGRIETIVTNVLYYSKKRKFVTEHVQVSDFLCELMGVMQAKIRDDSIELEKKIDSRPGSFSVDISALRSALMNIFENAIDACLSEDSKKKHHICFSARQTPRHIHFDISDDGPGMDEKTKQNMFNLFFSTKGSKGTGLGLFIARDVIEKHNGTIHVDSAKGRGTCAHVVIPT